MKQVLGHSIPIHNDDLQPGGIDLLSFSELSEAPTFSHRDDHYMLLLQQKGTSQWAIDFNDSKLEGAALCFVAPGQVHRYITSKHAAGWLFFIEPELLPAEYSMILDTFMYRRQVMPVGKDHPVFNQCHMLHRFIQEGQKALYQSVLHAYAGVLTGMFTAAFLPDAPGNILITSAKYQLTLSFKRLVKQQFREVKQVKAYAAQLNITPLYLNEVAKQVTGFAASYWIQKEILLEARRLLIYTDMDVKEIAFTLGYEDHAYFSRFFKKNTGATAGAFRQNNHHLSNHNH